MQTDGLIPIRVLLLASHPAREDIALVGSGPPELELDLVPEFLLRVVEGGVVLGRGTVVGDAEVEFLERAFALEWVLHFINKNYNNYKSISRR